MKLHTYWKNWVFGIKAKTWKEWPLRMLMRVYGYRVYYMPEPPEIFGVVEIRQIIKHNKRGTQYGYIGKGCIQSDTPLQDMDRVVVYVGDQDDIWVRKAEELTADRFKVCTKEDWESRNRING